MIEIQKSSPKHEEDRLSEKKPESTPLVSRSSLCRRLSRGVEARAQFVESHINKGLAYQLRAMREARKWSQEELASQVGMPQTAISRLESPNYGKPTITTLKRMARVYDVGLDVRFVPFSHLVDRMSRTPRLDMGLTSDSMDVPNFDEELEQGAFQYQVSTTIPVVQIVSVQETTLPRYGYESAGLVNVDSLLHIDAEGLVNNFYLGSRVNAVEPSTGYYFNAWTGKTPTEIADKKPAESEVAWFPIVPTKQIASVGGR